MEKVKESMEFPYRTEEDGSMSILVKDRMYIRNVKQKKDGEDIYGTYQGDPCVVTTINGHVTVIVIKLAK